MPCQYYPFSYLIFAVDTFLCTLLLLTFLFLSLWLSKNEFLFKSGCPNLWSGLCRQNVGYLIFPIVFLFFIYYFLKLKIFNTSFYSLVFAVITFTVFRIFQPYAFAGLFQINPKFTASLTQLNGILKQPRSLLPSGNPIS